MRFLSGCVIAFLGFNGLGWWGLLGILLIASAACGFCAVYWIFGLDSAAWELAFEKRHPARAPASRPSPPAEDAAKDAAPARSMNLSATENDNPWWNHSTMV